MRPRAGFNPTRPQHEAGIRIEPPPSFPCATARTSLKQQTLGATARAAGSAVRVPGVAGDPVTVVLCDGERPELRSVCPPAKDEPRLLERLGHELAFVARSLGGGVRPVGDWPAVHRCQVLYRDRHAGERTQVVAAGCDLVTELARAVARAWSSLRQITAFSTGLRRSTRSSAALIELERAHLVCAYPPRPRRVRR